MGVRGGSNSLRPGIRDIDVRLWFFEGSQIKKFKISDSMRTAIASPLGRGNLINQCEVFRSGVFVGVIGGRTEITVSPMRAVCLNYILAFVDKKQMLYRNLITYA